MDSGNSSSVQSSSGGDEEYDSRAEPISALLIPSSSALASPPHHHHLSQLPTTTSPNRRRHPLPPPASFFDPLSNYLDAFTRSLPPPPPAINSDSLLNLDMPWAPSGLRTPGQPSCTAMGSQFLGSALPTRETPIATLIGQSPTMPPSSPQQPSSSTPASEPLPSAAAQPRSSRKRSRASRRAPTTVLTTDTSNFRAMVQEFTGIPAPPFSSTSAFPLSRFDLFHATAASQAMRPSASSLLRPFPQKVPVPSFGPFVPGSSSSSSSSAPSAIATTAATTTSSTIAEGSLARAFTTNTPASNALSTSNTTSTASIGNSYKLPSVAALGDHQHQNLLNMFDFQLLQSSPTAKYNSLDAAVLGGDRDPQEPRMMPSVADYAVGGGVGHAIPSSRAGGGGGGGGGDGLLQWVEGSGGSEGGGPHPGQFRPAGRGYGSSQRRAGCKLNCTGPASTSESEKAPENAPARGEGMLDSWICSSD